jgi:ABC-type xylose transport system permease subunit
LRPSPRVARGFWRVRWAKVGSWARRDRAIAQDRGLPLVVCIVFALALGFAYLTERTRFGRHIASSVKFIVTGAVLITAVTIESVTRMRRQGET